MIETATIVALAKRYWWALAIVGAIILFRSWLALHDGRVRASERTQLEQTTIKRAEKATAKADAKADTRQEKINATVDDLRGSNSTDDWFERMRARQDAAPATGK